MQNDRSAACSGCSTTGAAAAPSAGIGRRAFLAQSAVLAAVAALAACGVAGGGDVTAPTLTGPATLKVSDYPALASVGGIALVNIGGGSLAVARTGASTFVALSRTCPHAGSTVNISGSGFLCPNHGAQFSANGTWIGGQPTGNLHAYATTYDAAAGTITIS